MAYNHHNNNNNSKINNIFFKYLSFIKLNDNNNNKLSSYISFQLQNILLFNVDFSFLLNKIIFWTVACSALAAWASVSGDGPYTIEKFKKPKMKKAFSYFQK